jgi:flavin-dependent dehydrogenase
MAAEVINKAIRRKDFSEEMLSEYDTDWRAYIGIKWELDLKMSEKVYGGLSDESWKEIMDFMSTLSPDEFFDMAFSYHYSGAVKFGRLIKLAKMLESVTFG